MCSQFLLTRIEKTKALIEAYEDAILALAPDSGINSYELDTGQGKQKVTRADSQKLNTTLDSLYNRLVTMEARCTGSGVVQVRAGRC